VEPPTVRIDVEPPPRARAGKHARRSSFPPIALGAAVALGALGGAGCERPTQRPAIVVPAASRDDDGRPLQLLPPGERATANDAVVRIVSDVTCTGTLVADDLVLTAHHCVTARDAKGRILQRDVRPKDITIELGGEHLPWGEVSVRAIVAPDCGWASGEGDIALLVLSRKLIGISPIPVREAPPARGEHVFPIGFGRCVGSYDLVHRVEREGGVVDGVRAGQFSGLASICPGDSGGPACVSPNADGTCREIVGVVSAAVMDADEHTVGTTVYTRTDLWKGLFSAAREIADGASPSEVPPYGPCRW
jgi:hypothetical protein